MKSGNEYTNRKKRRAAILKFFAIYLISLFFSCVIMWQLLSASITDNNCDLYKEELEKVQKQVKSQKEVMAWLKEINTQYVRVNHLKKQLVNTESEEDVARIQNRIDILLTRLMVDKNQTLTKLVNLDTTNQFNESAFSILRVVRTLNSHIDHIAKKVKPGLPEPKEEVDPTDPCIQDKEEVKALEEEMMAINGEITRLEIALEDKDDDLKTIKGDHSQLKEKLAKRTKNIKEIVSEASSILSNRNNPTKTDGRLLKMKLQEILEQVRAFELKSKEKSNGVIQVSKEK